ncbi:hypothetical protein HELRODRAFT_155381 [Helobdella robusta]|uniref:Methyltransferase domain-containing protein n=1 Tax=Helobdella robusta TaxID=6412 RepID=T1ELI1_HELRO|nr:hypothetical protein HELRODRAFT_155381 [Helobdella robusta]ESN92093.1 hypothetical protein HELRODRAFT_155381 [Helobdella robusta]
MAPMTSRNYFKRFFIATLTVCSVYLIWYNLYSANGDVGVMGDFDTRPAGNLSSYSIQQLKLIFFRVMTSGKKHCSNHTKHGRTTADGGYDVCFSANFTPSHNRCIVLSFGINNEWSFDEALSERGCYVHAFDPSLNKSDHMHSALIQFHNLGLGRLNEVNEKKWKMQNIKTILSSLQLQDRTIDVMKCDAEGAEWFLLEDVLKDLIDVKQIILEVHSLKRNPDTVSKEDLTYMINLFDNLQRAGYVVDHSYHKYSCCVAFSPFFPPGKDEKCCYEVYLLNTRYM